MEWNTKWDWDNIIGFGSKAMESPKKLQLADWMAVDDADIHNISGGSSAKSSVSACTDSSTKDGMQPPSSGNLSKKVELVTCNASAEALLGLKLGKRTYFENSNGSTVKSTSLSVKKTKPSAQNAPLCCQVEGCNIDLSLAKDYHRKHRVCDSHSKCPKVIVGGCERRFCQQCSRFHALSEFDEKKRSCRTRLSDHNARRRKPQQETIQFDSTRLSTPFYGGNEQMSFVLNNSRLAHSTTAGNCSWDSGCNSKFTLSKGCPLKFNGGAARQLHFPGMKTPQSIINMQNGILPSQNSASLLSDPGSKGRMISPLDVAAPSEYRRALSLLSSDSWDSCEPDYIPLYHQMQENNSGFVQPEGVPLSFSDFWLSEQHSTQHPHVPSLSTNSNFQEIQPYKTPYDADFYPSILN